MVPPDIRLASADILFINQEKKAELLPLPSGRGVSNLPRSIFVPMLLNVLNSLRKGKRTKLSIWFWNSYDHQEFSGLAIELGELFKRDWAAYMGLLPVVRREPHPPRLPAQAVCSRRPQQWCPCLSAHHSWLNLPTGSSCVPRQSSMCSGHALT